MNEKTNNELIDEAQIQRIKQQVHCGSYKSDATKAAAKMIEQVTESVLRRMSWTSCRKPS